MAQLPLEKEADVNAKDESGQTALHKAATNGHKAVALLLLEKGAGVSAKDESKRTALYWKAKKGYEAVT